MSAENVELVRRGYAAAAAGDLSTIRELLDPDVKWHGGNPADGCQNRAQTLRFMQRPGALGLGRLLDVIDAGDRVVVVLQPRDPHGATLPPRANVTTLRDGRVVEMVAYETPEAACAAAGVPAPPAGG